MVRDFGFKGFGRARTGGVCAALLIAAFSIVGCASGKVPEVGPWGYEFTLGTFSDQRPDDDAKMMAARPFNIDSFMRGWQHSVGRNVFANEQAKLDVTLMKYEATMSARSYAISMEVGMRGRTMVHGYGFNKPLGTVNAACSAVGRVDNTPWGDFWQQARAEGEVAPLTQATRDATMWQKVMDSCVKQLASQFGSTLVSGTK